MTRKEAIERIYQVWLCHDQESCWTDEHWKESDRERLETFRALGVMDHELREAGILIETIDV